MSARTITTATATERDNDTLVLLAAVGDMRPTEAGRIVDGDGFQPAVFAAWALTPETLRAIATLIEDTDRG